MPVFEYRPWPSYSASNEENVPALTFPSQNVEEFINQKYNPGQLRERYHFSRDSMGKVKAKAKAKAKANQECGTDKAISHFHALTAFLWRV